MKVKEQTDKPNFTKITEDLLKLGFRGGHLNSTRKKQVVEMHFSRTAYGPLQALGLKAVRLSAETDVALTVTWSSGKGLIWDYETTAQQKLATSSGLHAKLAVILGSQK